MQFKNKIIVALDVDSLEKTTPLVTQLAPHVGCFKVGLELLMAAGAPQVVGHIHSLGGEIFLDGKFNDIPNTVGAAAKATASLGVKMFNIHASAGIEAMRAAAKNKGKAILLAVTVLTSLDESETNQVFGGSIPDLVLQFATNALHAGVDGIICSPRELPILAASGKFDSMIKVTPGVRPAWAALNDQKRVLTPADTVRAGVNYIVIGRPITQPPKEIGSPVEAAKRVLQEMEEAVK